MLIYGNLNCYFIITRAIRLELIMRNLKFPILPIKLCSFFFSFYFKRKKNFFWIKILNRIIIYYLFILFFLIKKSLYYKVVEIFRSRSAAHSPEKKRFELSSAVAQRLANALPYQ